MIEYKDLSPYERELINKIIPKAFDPKLSYVHFDGILSNTIYDDHTPFKDVHKFNNQNLNALIRATKARITEFFIENEFIRHRQTTSGYERMPNGDKLRKAETIEKYYENEEQNRIKEEERFKPHLGDNIIVNARDISGSAFGNHALGLQSNFSNKVDSNIISDATVNPTPKPTSNVSGNFIGIIAIIVAIVGIIMTYLGCHH